MKRGLATLVSILVLSLLACSEDNQPEPEYGLIWQDEFEGPAGELPNPERWQFDIGTDWGNLQLEYDTNRPENVSLDGEGHLAITAREELFEGQDYTSARIKTKDLFERKWGRFEARIKLPVGQGIWPAFWMLGDDIDQVGWPQCGEIDIMEYRGQEPRVLHGTIHGPGYAGDNSIGNSHILAQGGFNLGFHEFAIEWDETGITWLVDGHVYHRAEPADVPPGSDWVFDHPHFILLNLAVGGRWVGSPDEETVFPQTMLVDWVRVYGTLP
ncbi:glycoside hydrolase family 16 protein [bacterium]|nr:glycoside hydrolase family 16 protein [bacterium]